MRITSVTLHNFRVYRGLHTLRLEPREGCNVTIVAGNNGYGKTSFLTALVWCFYGRGIQDVERKYKEDVQEAGGYKKYAATHLNRLARAEGETTYAVSVALADLHIPGLPCRELCIHRAFDVAREEETVQITLDGAENELTRGVGDEVFINDFVLPKEIAKFFFFDAEKIVALAELKSLPDKRALSRAYSEVLGIKKYEDLRDNLEALRIRLRRSAASGADRRKLDTLRREIQTAHDLLDLHDQTAAQLLDEKVAKRAFADQLQERLIREGNAMSADELTRLKKVQQRLSEEAEHHRATLRDLLELAPFAIAGQATRAVKTQLEFEKQRASQRFDPATARALAERINREVRHLILPDESIHRIRDIVVRHLTEGLPDDEGDRKVLLNFTETEQHEFEALFNHLRFSFRQSFRQLAKDYKNNRTVFNKVTRQITEAEAKETDLFVQQVREEKTAVDNRLHDIDAELASLHVKMGGLHRDLAVKTRQEAELAKRVRLEDADRQKDETAARLIDHLTRFLQTLKQGKKTALESALKTNLDALMHKADFVGRVEVTVDADLIDIFLYDAHEQFIPKESLSKGEQQLYATALLKALVDESNIRFPVFIDSPLQKFDSGHTRNVISEFYPHISGQVVLFPLLQKELTAEEYALFRHHVSQAYLIEHHGPAGSSFRQVPVRGLFKSLDRTAVRRPKSGSKSKRLSRSVNG